MQQRFLLCYDNCIVEIDFEWDWQLTSEQMTVVTEKLEKENRLLIAVDGGGNKICTGISLDDSYLSSKLPLSDESSLSVCTDKNHPDVIQNFITYCIWGK